MPSPAHLLGAFLCLLALAPPPPLGGPPLAHGAITGGSSAGTSNIKLSKGGKGGGRRGGRRQPQQQQQQPPPPPPAEPRPEVTMAPDDPPPPPPCGTDSATLHIVEPPEGATVKGSSFDVRVAIEPCDTDLFNESYAGPTSRVCVALDSSPYYCWPVVGGRIRFVGAVDGQHTVTAVLMKQGQLLPETETGVRAFASIEDPNEVDDDEEEVVGEEGDIDLDKQEEQVTLGIPNLEMILPFEKVTLPGSQLTVVSRVKTADEDRAKFDEYFAHQFTCYNLDAGTASPCWSIFGENSTPFIAGLSPGLHTLDGVITHPETRKGIPETATETRTFFTAGDNNEAAEVVVTVEVDEELASIPVASGGDAYNQGFYFCGLRGIEDESCSGYVARRILSAWEGLAGAGGGGSGVVEVI